MRKFSGQFLDSLILFFCLFIFPTFLLIGVEKKEHNLTSLYIQHCKQPSDINEHLPILAKYAKKCSSVVEIGRGSSIATWGILHGLSKNSFEKRSYLGIHLNKPSIQQIDLVKKLTRDKNIQVTFWNTDDLHIFIEPTDMLFIDSLHTYCHLTYELETFSCRVRKYICLHDTSEPFGYQNEDVPDALEYASCDKTKKGLWQAVKDFLVSHSEWSLVEHLTNNHGFVVLKRIKEEVPHSFSDSLVDAYLNKKIILCTGPALGRFQMLKTTTNADLSLIPFKKIFITTNDPKILNIRFKGRKPNFCYLIPNRGKQVDCVNCIISTMRHAVHDPEVDDDDIILFKHESVHVNDMELIKKAIHKIVNEGYDMVNRRPAIEWGGPVTATDAFFVKVSAIRQIIANYPDVTELPPEAWFCELYVHENISKYIPKIYSVFYAHNNGGFTELGFYHYPAVVTPEYPVWDRKNRSQLFLEK